VIKPIYIVLLRLYPWDYTVAFAPEMLRTFQAASEEERRRGWVSFMGFLLTEFASLAIGVGAEWLAKFTTDESVRGRRLPDLRRMRPSKISQELWFAAAGGEGKQD
jgi:hypothetical protein